MRFLFRGCAVAALVALAAGPAGAQHCFGHHARPVALVAPVTYAPAVGYAPVTYAPLLQPYIHQAPVGYAPQYAPSYAPQYAPVQASLPVHITSLQLAAPVGLHATAATAAAAPTMATADVGDCLQRITAALGRLTRVVEAHDSALQAHDNSLRGIEQRAARLEVKAGIAPPVPK